MKSHLSARKPERQRFLRINYHPTPVRKIIMRFPIQLLFVLALVVASMLPTFAAPADQVYFGYRSTQKADGPSREQLRMSSMTIIQVDPGSPADRSHLNVGDSIVEYGGTVVEGALASKVIAIHDSLKPGDTLTIKIVDASGVERTVELVAQPMPAQK